MLPDKSNKLAMAAAPGDAVLAVETDIAQWAFDKGQPAGFATDALPDSDVLYIPLGAPYLARGVLAVKAHNRRLLRIPEQRQLLETFAALVAIALERVHYVGLAQEALLKMESERLRNSLLAAAQLEAAELMQEEARRMTALVSNLLDVARIERGEVGLHLEWQPLEEVAGVALNATEQILKKHRVHVRVANDLPLVEIDAALITRVLVNLLENASKYTPAGSDVTLSAEVIGDQLSVSVFDHGPGLPAGKEDEVFQKFNRGHRESSTRGLGLGLTWNSECP
jgi:two-component system sensor histidine kinase KdpD